MNVVLLIGIVIIIAGVALLAQGIQNRRGAQRGLGGVLIAIGAGAAILSVSFVVVPAGHAGVLFNIIGGVQDDELGEGVHIVFPVLQHVVHYDVRQREITLARETNDMIAGRSSEGLEITTDVTIIYQLTRDQTSRLHRQIGPDYEHVRIRPVVRSQIRDALADFRAADLISAERAELQRQIESTIVPELDKDNIRIMNVLLRDVRIPEAITAAIEEKQAAEQQVEVEENLRLRAEIAAQRVVVEAEGQRDAEIARAQGEAEALSLRGTAIRENPEIIQLEVAQKLAPSIQTIMLPSDNNFLLDVRGLTDRPAGTAGQ